MEILLNNFLRLLRAGAFGTEEAIEPMSAWKWRQVFKLSVAHGVAAVTYSGISKLSDQFFLQVPEDALAEWRNVVDEADERPLYDHLASKLYNHRLQNILDEAGRDSMERELLVLIVQNARHLMNDGLSFRHLTALGLYLRRTGLLLDNHLVQKWLHAIGMQRMAQLQAQLLVELLSFDEEEIGFASAGHSAMPQALLDDLLKPVAMKGETLNFEQQGNDIFLHASHTQGARWHARHTLRFLRYCPAESVSNLMASFVHSLRNIEE